MKIKENYFLQKGFIQLPVLAIVVLVVASLTLPFVANQLSQRQTTQERATSQVTVAPWDTPIPEPQEPISITRAPFDVWCEGVIYKLYQKIDNNWVQVKGSTLSVSINTPLKVTIDRKNATSCNGNWDNVSLRFSEDTGGGIYGIKNIGLNITGNTTYEAELGSIEKSGSHKVFLAVNNTECLCNEFNFSTSCGGQGEGACPNPTPVPTSIWINPALPSCTILDKPADYQETPFQHNMQIRFEYQNSEKAAIYIGKKVNGKTTWNSSPTIKEFGGNQGTWSGNIMAPFEVGEYEVVINVFNGCSTSPKYYCGVGGNTESKGILYSVDKCTDGFTKTNLSQECTNLCRKTFRVTSAGASTIATKKADDADLTSPMVRAGTGNCRYAYTPNANQGKMEFNFSIPEAKDYYVWTYTIRGTSSSQRSANSFYFAFDNAELQGKYNEIPPTSSGANEGWTRLKDENTGQIKFNLSQGNHKLFFGGREANTKLIRILVTDNESYTPSTSYSCSGSPGPTTRPTTRPTTPPNPTSTPVPTCNCPAGKRAKNLGNADCNDTTDGNDLTIFLDELFRKETTKKSDFNCDGKVNGFDFEIWRKNKE